MLNHITDARDHARYSKTLKANFKQAIDQRVNFTRSAPVRAATITQYATPDFSPLVREFLDDCGYSK